MDITSLVGTLAPIIVAITGMFVVVRELREKTAVSDARLIAAQDERIRKLELDMETGKAVIESLRAQIDHLEAAVSERDRRIILLEHDLAAAQERIRVLENVPAPKPKQ